MPGGLPPRHVAELAMATSDGFAGGRPPTVQRGVRAGEGGVFTDSVPALVTGGVLIAGALGAAAHRLRRLRGRRYAAGRTTR